MNIMYCSCASEQGHLLLFQNLQLYSIWNCSSNNLMIENHAMRLTKRNVSSILNTPVQHQVITMITSSHSNLRVKTWNVYPTRKATGLTKNKLCMTRSPSKRQDTNGFSNSVETRNSQLEIQHQESCRRYALEGEEY